MATAYPTVPVCLQAALGGYAAIVHDLEGQVARLALQREVDQRDLRHRVQCAIADQTLHLVLEITALRSKVPLPFCNMPPKPGFS